MKIKNLSIVLSIILSFIICYFPFGIRIKEIENKIYDFNEKIFKGL